MEMWMFILEQAVFGEFISDRNEQVKQVLSLPKARRGAFKAQIEQT